MEETKQELEAIREEIKQMRLDMQKAELGIYSMKDVCDILGFNVQTIRRYIREGKLKASKFKTFYFTKENLMEFMKNNEWSKEQ